MNLYRLNIDECKGIPELEKSCKILESGYKSVSSFFDLFNEIRKDPLDQRKKGGTTVKEQDLLRAMLLFSSSTLDSAIKQLIKDALGKVILKDIGARKMLEDHIERKLRKGDPLDEKRKDGIISVDSKYLASILASVDPQASLVESMIKELGEDSVQSVDRLLRIAAHFAITREQIIEDLTRMKLVFGARNEITHEMDINFGRPNFIRRPRTVKIMLQHTNLLFLTVEKFLRVVKSKLE